MPKSELNLHVVAPNIVDWKISLSNEHGSMKSIINDAIPRVSKMEVDIIFNNGGVGTQRMTLDFKNITQRAFDAGNLRWEIEKYTIHISKK